jgi:hypothetical protein
MDNHEEQTPENEIEEPAISDADLPEDQGDEVVSDSGDAEDEDVADSDSESESGEILESDDETVSDDDEDSADAGTQPDDGLITGELDIEAALASVSALDDALAEHVAAEEEEAGRIVAEAAAIEQVNEALRVQAEQRAAYQLPRPPIITVLQRGQIASAIPALLLMAIGAWLTFVLTTSETGPSSGTVVAVVFGACGISLLSYWLASGRWARGALFGGLTLLIFVAVAIYVTESAEPIAEQWPLFIIALALAVLLSAFLSPPVGDGHVLLGVILSVAGVAALAATTVLSDDVLDVASAFSPVVLVLAVLVFLLPKIPKRNS